MERREWSVTLRIPDEGEVVECYGYKTYCCQMDMEEERNWHTAKFKIFVSQYKLKDDVPEDPEESIFEFIDSVEHWGIVDPMTGYSDNPMGHVIGVTKWRKIDE